jgi:hypothetical protein
MKVYLEKDRQHMAQLVTVTHATVAELMRKIGCGHIWTISFLPLNYLLSGPRSIYCCGTVRLNRRGMPHNT